MISKYRIKETFKMAGRGLVLAGYIEEGTISVGDYIEFAAFDKKSYLKIIGVEGIRKADIHMTNTGLLVKCEDENEIDELKDWRPKDELELITEE